MTSSTPDLTEASRPANDHAARLPYEAPELIDQGDVAEQTKSAGIASGADGAYS
jgi:hypothetical protein